MGERIPKSYLIIEQVIDERKKAREKDIPIVSVDSVLEEARKKMPMGKKSCSKSIGTFERMGKMYLF